MVERLSSRELHIFTKSEKRKLGAAVAVFTLIIGGVFVTDHISTERIIKEVESAPRTEIIIQPGDRLENIAKQSEASDGVEGNVNFHLYEDIIKEENDISASDFPVGKRIYVPDHGGKYD
jgi:cell division protein YceG involved in septum cleavage